LDLNQVGIGVGHAERGEDVAAARNNYQSAGPIVGFGFAAIAVLNRR